MQFGDSPERYNVVWDSPSQDQHGSVPLGNGSTGLNAWIEPNGDLVFYISRTDSWGGNGRLLKLGGVRITLDPAPSTDDFLQTLSLVDGTLKVRCGKTDIRLWVDANHPVIHVEADGPERTDATAAIELWREGDDSDTVLKNLDGTVGWYHRNVYSSEPAALAEAQGLTAFERQDPLLHRTFGAVIKATGAQRIDDTHLRSASSRKHRFDIYVLARHPATEDEWRAGVDQVIADVEATSFSVRRAAHETWWKAFWQRSWFHVTATGAQKDDAFVISRAYALQRYVTACGARGAYPIKFNGSIFTVEHEGKPHNADFRQWGPGYWWQNTRMPYLGMCTSGDFEMTDALYKMYCKDLLEYHKHRAKVHTGHEGLYIPETMLFYGNHRTADYGKTPFAERTDKLQESNWHKWEWVSGLELGYMMLDRYEHTLDEGFLKDTIIPFTHDVLRFFDLHYETGLDGKLVMHPSQALETWWECTNPMPEVAGLHAVTDRLLALPENLTDPEMRKQWAEVKAKIPDLPTREVDGVKMFAPAETFANCRNSEVPELYSVFPFRLCAFEKNNVELGREAFRQPGPRGHNGWRQDDIFLAYLGLTEAARKGVVSRARNTHKESRFPAFFGPNMDWTPDQTHGGVLQKALQAMILQTEGKKIFIAPAWPKEWNIEFKLHAPYKTVVEGKVVDGELVDLKVTPESRRKDVVD
jgi:alpha-L-fucosidase 2